MSVSPGFDREAGSQAAADGRTVRHSAVTMSGLILPYQAGRGSFAHGGEIMKRMDEAAGVVAVRHAHSAVVTARVEDLNFYRPIKVGDFVTVNAFLTFAGRSSMVVRVEVTTEDIVNEKSEHALTAYFVMVALDDQGKPTKVPPLIVSSEEERRLWEDGKRRYATCKRDLMAGDDNFRSCREEPPVAAAPPRSQ